MGASCGVVMKRRTQQTISQWLSGSAEAQKSIGFGANIRSEDLRKLDQPSRRFLVFQAETSRNVKKFQVGLLQIIAVLIFIGFLNVGLSPTPDYADGAGNGGVVVSHPPWALSNFAVAFLAIISIYQGPLLQIMSQTNLSRSTAFFAVIDVLAAATHLSLLLVELIEGKSDLYNNVNSTVGFSFLIVTAVARFVNIFVSMWLIVTMVRFSSFLPKVSALGWRPGFIRTYKEMMLVLKVYRSETKELRGVLNGSRSKKKRRKKQVLRDFY